ncbi:MAG: TfoX/Sxy family protein [Bacteroidetes bacterium]|nr:TfoX/Sxy family protein [Bacteroidota bacterium]
MMGGLTFMYNDKMCVGIIKDELMCRIDPAIQDECLEKLGCRNGLYKATYEGLCDDRRSGMRSENDFNY